MKPLTKFSQRNLAVIQNFLLYANMEEELGQTAIDYISEDHVDGEDSPQAILERALGSELIGEDIYLEEDLGETNPCRIFADKDSIIYAVDAEDNVTLFGLRDEQDVIASKHRDEILTYCLHAYYSTDEVSLMDIFMHGKYVKKLSE
tara:strand:+ start:201 stop:641 length:441 start_codon:yes stop_codon:yes gene_type:complete